MKKHLKALRKWFKSQGMKKEFFMLNQIIRTAVPIEDIYRLPSTKPKMEPDPDYPEDQRIAEDDYGDEIWEEIEPTSKDDVRVPGYTTDEWYDTLSFLGTSVVLIPFDQDDLTEQDVDALGRVFGHYTSDYDDLRENANSFSSDVYNSEGNLDVLKVVFPGLWKAISAMIKEKGLDEDNITYLLYNEKTPPPRGLFQAEVSPRYFGHDIGHIEEDFGENYDFKWIITSYLTEAAKHYYLEDDEGEMGQSLHDYLLGQSYDDEHIEDEYILKLVPDFFSTFSAGGDELYDVFGDLMKGEHEVEIPDTIYYYNSGDNNNFVKAEDDSALLALEEGLLSSMEEYAKGDSGPLSGSKGSVMLYDTGL
jgi:hypothetical protein